MKNIDKLFMSVFLYVIFVGSSLAEKCYSISDESGNSGSYTASGKSCNPSRSGELGDWSGVDSIGSWLGLILIISFIVWFIKGYFEEINKKK